MSLELPVITDPSELTKAVTHIRTAENPGAIMSHLGGGILKFAGATFPDINTEDIYAQSNNREPEGRGAHFDVYGSFLDKNYPWLGLFNLAGRASLTTVTLPDELAKIYFDMYPTPTDEAFDARRHFSAIALGSKKAEITSGTLTSGTGLVLPQKDIGSHIVHDIVPEDPNQPGKYVKLIVPSGTEEANDRMRRGGYKPLDELLSEGLGLTIETDTGEKFPETSLEPLRSPPTRRTRRGFGQVRPPTFASEEDEPYRRSCNLD